MTHQPVGPVLRPCENEHRIHLGPLQQLGEERALALTGHRIDCMRHRIYGLRTKPDLHQERFAEVLACERLDFGGHRCTEEERLPIGRHLTHDLVDLRRESHVEHSVGLVEDENLEIVEDQVLALEVVDQAARRGDDDVDSAAQRSLLRTERDSAKDFGDAQAAVAAVLLEALAHLRGELAGWSENQGSQPSRTAEEALDDRERECGGLAGACLSQADEVAPLERERDRLGLNWRRLPVPRVANCVEERWREAERLECGERFNCGLHVTYCAGSARLRGAFPETGAPSAAPSWRVPEVELSEGSADSAALQRANVPSGWNRLHGQRLGRPVHQM
jgi:hypothetical protein